MQTIAIIPARGGSKRIPRKNIRPFCGKPMIARSIEAALASGVFDAVVVSTDDEEIASVSESCGAQAPFRRPQDLSNDHAANHASDRSRHSLVGGKSCDCELVMILMVL